VDRDAQQAFSTVPEITGIVSHSQEGGRHHYRLQVSNDAAPVIAQALNRDGVLLYALQPQRRDLETIFAEVNEEVVNG
jgi:ABC-2 type transport system ATP-binding protein